MRIAITHTVNYAYDRPVFVDPHVLRLRPSHELAQRLQRFQCQIAPTPQHVSQALDHNDNHAAFACFRGTTERLTIEATSEVTTLLTNPFDYILHTRAGELDQLYDDGLRRSLSPFLETKHGPVDCDDGDQTPKNTGPVALAEEIADRTSRRTLSFLDDLNADLNRRFEFVVREHGAPFMPAETLRRSKVSCRDVAVLFIHMCRVAGVAARFVSGYTVPDADATEHYMHAWSEVYLPGAGWRGYDPTTGLAVGDHHVVVARSEDPIHAAPVFGSIRGTGASSEMSTMVCVSVIRA